METIGRYKIVRELGRGAMGVVYHAIDPNIGRPVAIKTIRFGDKKPEELERMRERLFREARSAGMLSHPGIVTIYDVEQQGDLAYIAMEFVDGPTLDQVLNDGEPLAADNMFSVLGQTAVALDYAHSKGIVHRDIKPANIMLSEDGTAKIADFGIAKIFQSDKRGTMIGTEGYAPPDTAGAEGTRRQATPAARPAGSRSTRRSAGRGRPAAGRLLAVDQVLRQGQCASEGSLPHRERGTARDWPVPRGRRADRAGG